MPDIFSPFKYYSSKIKFAILDVSWLVTILFVSRFWANLVDGYLHK